MRTEKKDGSRERRLLHGMIFSDLFLARISSKWKGEGLFDSEWSNTVGGWCAAHYENYDCAPKGDIRGLFEEWSETGPDKETSLLVERFLSHLLEEQKEEKEGPNVDLLIDLAGSHFGNIARKKLAREIMQDVEAEQGQRADEKIAAYSRVELGGGSYIEPFTDTTPVRLAFQAQKEPLISMEGELGSFYGSALGRDCFVAYMAPEKGLKSSMLMDLAYRAMLQRKRVSYFVIGDMSEGQVLLRLMSRSARKPYLPEDGKWPSRVKWPVSLRPGEIKKRDDDDVRYPLPEMEWNTKKFTQALTEEEAVQSCTEVMKTKVKSKKPYMRISVHPGGTISARQVFNLLKTWNSEGYQSDVIVLDYADNLNHDRPKLEIRDGICQTWLELRRISQELHCLLVTATQCNREGYESRCLNRRHVSDDKRKLAHLTAGFGINMTPFEKEMGVCRLNCIVRREGAYSYRKCLYVAQCLALCDPCVLSCWE